MISSSDDNDYKDVDVKHPLHKISDFKSLAKGSIDVAYLFATVNQLRTAYQLAAPYEALVVGLLVFSIVLQVTSSILLLVEKMSEPMSYNKRKNINISIGVMMILIIFLNVLTTAFSGPENLKP